MISSGSVETVKISDLKKMISCGVLTTADLKLEEDQFWNYYFFWDGVDPRPKEDDQLGIFKMVQIWNLQNCYTIRWSPGQILGWGNCNTTLRGPRRRLHHLMFRVLTTWAAEASLHTWVLTVEKVVPSQELPILCIWDIQSSHELLSNPHTPGL